MSSFNISEELYNKEIFDMATEICNFCMGKTKLGIYAKRELTSTGGKYKWTDGEVIHLLVDNIELKISIKRWYVDNNSYDVKDLLVKTVYNIDNKCNILDTDFKIMNFLKSKIRKIRISKILNNK